MRLEDDAVAAQEIPLPREVEALHTAAEPAEFDGHVDAVRVDGHVVAVGIDAKLRRNAGLEEGDLQREISVAEHPAVVRSALEIICGCMRVAVAAGRGQLRIAAGRQKG